MQQQQLRRVAVTGIGAITPVGNDAESFWQAILAGTSGIGPITRVRRVEAQRARRRRGEGLRPDARSWTIGRRGVRAASPSSR